MMRRELPRATATVTSTVTAEQRNAAGGHGGVRRLNRATGCARALTDEASTFRVSG